LAVIIILACTIILLFGVKDSATFNLVITILNVITILFIIVLGAFYVDTSNWDPFLPFGMSGAFAGAGTVFFSYIGFDSVSSLAGEVKNPARDLPIGIVGTLLIATCLYVGVSLVITGMVKYSQIDHGAPLAVAFQDHGLKWAAIIIAIGSVTALTATTLCSLLGQPRIYYQMAKDGLIYPAFGTVNAKTQAPVFGTIVTGVLSSILALVLDLDTLADMISIGTLLAFTVVCAGVIVLRLDKNGDTALKIAKADSDRIYLLHGTSPSRMRGLDAIPAPPLLFIFFVGCVFFSLVFKLGWPMWALAIPGTPMVAVWVILQLRKQVNLPTTFRCPLVPLLPLLGMLVNVFLILQLPAAGEALIRVAVWSVVGFIIYFGYGIRHSKLNNSPDTDVQ
jgi:APA family basic amino acid/polyamine antiporter